MITIEVSELKKFLINSKSIKDNRLLPILSYIKLDCSEESVTLTKTNNNAFVVMDIKATWEKPTSVLIEEKIISAAVQFAKADVITITEADNYVIIDDGFRKTRCQHQDVVNFSKIPNNDEEAVVLSTEVISALTIAKGMSLSRSDKGTASWMEYVYITKFGKQSCVFGTSGGVIYIKTFTRLPDLVLEPDSINAIAKHPELDYSTNGKFDFFSGDGVRYGFIKPEIRCNDLNGIKKKLEQDADFTISRKDFLSFCEFVVNMNTSSVPPEVSVSDGGKAQVKMTFSAMSDNEGTSEVLEVTGKAAKIPELYFLSRNIITAIRELQVDNLRIAVKDKMMIFSSEEEPDYLGCVTALVKQN